jgi:tetrahydromethanopterin S-methyltransferase subunit H
MESAMRTFNRNQKMYTIGGIEIGGQPGERPTVLIGSMFYTGHQIVADAEKGIFDEKSAKVLLDREAEISGETGIPRFIDVVGNSSEALIRYIEFVAGQTTSPILVDSPSLRVRMETIRHFRGSEIIPRLIYNSIDPDNTEEELDCIKECGMKNAVLLAFSTRAMKPSSKLRLLEESLIPSAQAAGIDHILIDTGILDVPNAAWASLAIQEIKENLGYPTGCAPANAIHTWRKMESKGQSRYSAAVSAMLALIICSGADFILYGSLRNAPWIYSAAATTDALIAYAGRFTGIHPVTRLHPLYKIM